MKDGEARSSASQQRLERGAREAGVLGDLQACRLRIEKLENERDKLAEKALNAEEQKEVCVLPAVAETAKSAVLTDVSAHARLFG